MNVGGKERELWPPIFEGGRWGYVDKSGTFVVQPQFDSTHDFSEGLALTLTAHRWAYIDPTGKITIEVQHESGRHTNWADSFSEGLAAVHVSGLGTGYIDRSGKFVI